MPIPIRLAGWLCFVVMLASWIFGTSMVDLGFASLILATGILLQIQGRVIWWIVTPLAAIGFLFFFIRTIQLFAWHASWFDLSITLLSLLLCGIIIGLLRMPTSRNYYRETPEQDL